MRNDTSCCVPRLGFVKQPREDPRLVMFFLMFRPSTRPAFSPLFFPNVVLNDTDFLIPLLTDLVAVEVLESRSHWAVDIMILTCESILSLVT